MMAKDTFGHVFYGVIQGHVGDGDVGDVGQRLDLMGPQRLVAKETRQQNQRRLGGHADIPLPVPAPVEG